VELVQGKLAYGRAELALQASSCCFLGDSKLLGLWLISDLLQWCLSCCFLRLWGRRTFSEKCKGDQEDLRGCNSGTNASRCPTPGCGGSCMLSVGITVVLQAGVKNTPSRPSVSLYSMIFFKDTSGCSVAGPTHPCLLGSPVEET